MEQLPFMTWSILLSYLPIDDVVRSRRICKYFKSNLESEHAKDLWIFLTERDFRFLNNGKNFIFAPSSSCEKSDDEEETNFTNATATSSTSTTSVSTTEMISKFSKSLFIIGKFHNINNMMFCEGRAMYSFAALASFYPGIVGDFLLTSIFAVKRLEQQQFENENENEEEEQQQQDEENNNNSTTRKKDDLSPLTFTKTLIDFSATALASGDDDDETDINVDVKDIRRRVRKKYRSHLFYSQYNSQHKKSRLFSEDFDYLRNQHNGELEFYVDEEGENFIPQACPPKMRLPGHSSVRGSLYHQRAGKFCSLPIDMTSELYRKKYDGTVKIEFEKKTKVEQDEKYIINNNNKMMMNVTARSFTSKIILKELYQFLDQDPNSVFDLRKKYVDHEDNDDFLKFDQHELSTAISDCLVQVFCFSEQQKQRQKQNKQKNQQQQEQENSSVLASLIVEENTQTTFSLVCTDALFLLSVFYANQHVSNVGSGARGSVTIEIESKLNQVATHKLKMHDLTRIDPEVINDFVNHLYLFFIVGILLPFVSVLIPSFLLGWIPPFLLDSIVGIGKLLFGAPFYELLWTNRGRCPNVFFGTDNNIFTVNRTQEYFDFQEVVSSITSTTTTFKNSPSTSTWLLSVIYAILTAKEIPLISPLIRNLVNTELFQHFVSSVFVFIRIAIRSFSQILFFIPILLFFQYLMMRIAKKMSRDFSPFSLPLNPSLNPLKYSVSCHIVLSPELWSPIPSLLLLSLWTAGFVQRLLRASYYFCFQHSTVSTFCYYLFTSETSSESVSGSITIVICFFILNIYILYQMFYVAIVGTLFPPEQSTEKKQIKNNNGKTTQNKPTTTTTTATTAALSLQSRKKHQIRRARTSNPINSNRNLIHTARNYYFPPHPQIQAKEWELKFLWCCCCFAKMLTECLCFGFYFLAGSNSLVLVAMLPGILTLIASIFESEITEPKNKFEMLHDGLKIIIFGVVLIGSLLYLPVPH